MRHNKEMEKLMNEQNKILRIITTKQLKEFRKSDILLKNLYLAMKTITSPMCESFVSQKGGKFNISKADSSLLFFIEHYAENYKYRKLIDKLKYFDDETIENFNYWLDCAIKSNTEEEYIGMNFIRKI